MVKGGVAQVPGPHAAGAAALQPRFSLVAGRDSGGALRPMTAGYAAPTRPTQKKGRHQTALLTSCKPVGYLSTDLSSLPISAGFLVTLMPHALMTSSFSCAVPFPPEMMAPAWP